MIEKDFWRGFQPLLLAFGVTQLAQQVDIIMVARLGGGAPAAYVMLTRMAVVDTVLMTAMGFVTSVAVAKARRNGGASQVIRQVLTLALLMGVCIGALGLLFYPRLARWLAGDGEIAALIGAAILWYALATPLRFLVNTSVFVLHVLGDGAMVVQWKLIESVMKAAGNFLFMDVLGFGFSGCFVSSLIIGIFSTMWCWCLLSPHHAHRLCIPGHSWTLKFLRSTGWETQRITSMQMAVLASLALFASPWLGRGDLSRLNSYAAGQTLILLVFAPLMALSRFLAFRLAELRERRRVAPFVQALWLQGAPLVVAAASILFVSDDWLGDFYGQHGPWWSVLIQALAVSLPLRYATNVMRAVLQAQGSFGIVTAADATVPWLVAVPLVALGLYFDAPVIAYQSLILPEAACAVWLWRRLHVTVQPKLPNLGI